MEIECSAVPDTLPLRPGLGVAAEKRSRMSVVTMYESVIYVT